MGRCFDRRAEKAVSLLARLSQTGRRTAVLRPAIGHEADASEAEDHHRPGGWFGDAAGRIDDHAAVEIGDLKVFDFLEARVGNQRQLVDLAAVEGEHSEGEVGVVVETGVSVAILKNVVDVAGDCEAEAGDIPVVKQLYVVEEVPERVAGDGDVEARETVATGRLDGSEAIRKVEIDGAIEVNDGCAVLRTDVAKAILRGTAFEKDFLLSGANADR